MTSVLPQQTSTSRSFAKKSSRKKRASPPRNKNDSSSSSTRTASEGRTASGAEVKTLIDILNTEYQIDGPNHYTTFPSLNVSAAALVAALKKQILKLSREADFDGPPIRIKDVRLNGGAAGSILSHNKNRGVGAYSYNDVDLLFSLDFDKKQFEAAFTLVRKALMVCLRDFMPPGVNKQSLTLDMLCQAYVQKQVMIPARWEEDDLLESGRTDFDCWSLLSLRCHNGPFLEFKFCQKMARQYQFATDSCQIILTDRLLSQCASVRNAADKSNRKLNHTTPYNRDDEGYPSSNENWHKGNAGSHPPTGSPEKRLANLSMHPARSPSPSDTTSDHRSTTSTTTTDDHQQADCDASDQSTAALCESEDGEDDVPAPAAPATSAKKARAKRKKSPTRRRPERPSSSESDSDISDSKPTGSVSAAPSNIPKRRPEKEDQDALGADEPGQMTLPQSSRRREQDASPAVVYGESSSYGTDDEQLDDDDESDVWIHCLTGDINDMEQSMRNKIINIINPECVRGGGFLKYCDLLSQGYNIRWDQTTRGKREASMHARFCIDFSTYAKVVYQINMYVEAHFRSGKEDLFQFFKHMITILRQLYQQGTPHSYEMMRWVYHIMCLYFGQPMRRPTHLQQHTAPPVIQQDAMAFSMMPTWNQVAAPSQQQKTIEAAFQTACENASSSVSSPAIVLPGW